MDNMASFTTRVELQDASSEEYEVLHGAMEAKGFSRTIASNEGTEYYLPDAEYNLVGDFQKSDILAMAKQAVDAVGKSARVLVTESAGRSWSNLKKLN